MLEPRPALTAGPVPGPTRAAAGLALLLFPFAMIGCSERMTGPTDQLDVSVDEVRLWVGDTVTIAASITASDGSPIAGSITWSSETSAVVVTPEGVVTAVRRGEGHLEVKADGKSARVPVTALPVIRGRLHSPVAAELSELTAYWSAGNTTDAVPIAGDGSFTIRASTVDAAGELVIDGGEPRAFHPFLYPFAVDSLKHADIVLVPRQWTIRNGIFTDETVEISLDTVMDEPTYNLTYYMVRVGDGRLRVDLGSWPLERFPATVVFDHRHSVPAITASDSVQIWGVLHRMEEIFGIDLFEPGVAEPDWWPSPDGMDRIPGVIRLGFREDLVGSGGGGADESTLIWEQDLGPWVAEGRFRRFTVEHRLLDSGRLLLGGLRSLGPLTWEEVLVHEMLHVFGMGHNSKMPTPQGARSDPLTTSEPTPHDVAYIELLHDIMQLEREHETFLGLLPATIGERRLMLDLPALPTLLPR